MRKDRVPVSTEKTGCIPFNIKQKSDKGYRVGENPVKDNGYLVDSFADALNQMRGMRIAGWRDYGSGNSQSAHKAIGWVTTVDANRLLAEVSNQKRVALFRSLADVVE